MSDAEIDPRRQVVLAALAAKEPIDQRERASIERTLADVRGLPLPFDRNADLIHVTGSGLVVGPRGVILLRHKTLGIWVQPGGHLDPGETPWEAACRETTEETGLDVHLADGDQLLHVDVHEAGPHLHLDLRYLLAGADLERDPDPPAGESQEVAWFGWEEALAVAGPGQLVGFLTHLRDRFA